MLFPPRNGPILVLASVFAFGCGEKPKPKNPSDVVSPAAQVAPVAPKRKLSGEAKKDFGKAVERYKSAAKAGLDPSSCADVANEFADVYDEHPQTVEAKFNEAAVWHECGDDKKAEQIYLGLLQKHPGHGPTLNNLGQIYMKRGQSGAALSQWQKAAARKNSEGYTNLALLQRERALRGDTAALREAVDNIHRALAVDSFNIEAYNTFATLLYDHARTPPQLEMARLICVQATKLDANYAPVYNVLGLIMLKQGRVTPALKQFRKAVARKPNFVEALMNIGAVTLSFRDYTSAEAAFRKVLEQKPNKETQYAATVGLGVALRGQSKFDEAMAQYKAAEALDPGNNDIAYNMGILVQDYTFDASDPATGIATLQKAVSHLRRYLSGSKNKRQVADAKRRVKNINEMVPMLREQQKMMQQAPAKK